uniref:Uncharacterized protein n=1 Tax=Plectus sambesii TaxID=2011161 RepID=A0A914VNU6_9BILA
MMMTDRFADSLVGLSEVSTPPCSNEECASLRQSTAILSRMFADLSSQAEICQQTKLERDTYRNLVDEKEKYIAVQTADKRQLEQEINALKLEKQRVESKHVDLQASISSLQQRADHAETYEARANQFEQKLEEQSVELRTANEKRRLVAEKYKETVLLAKTHMEAAERDAKKVVKLQDQMKSLHTQITLLRAKPHSSPHLLKFTEECCEILSTFDLMTPKLNARLKRFQSGALTSTSIGSDDFDDDELAAHLEQLVADGDQPAEQQKVTPKEPPQKKAKAAGGRVKSTKVPSADLVAMAHASDRKRRYVAVPPREAVQKVEEERPLEIVDDDDVSQCVCDGAVERLFAAKLLAELGDRISPPAVKHFDVGRKTDATVAAKRTEGPPKMARAVSTEATAAAKKAEVPTTAAASTTETAPSANKKDEPMTTAAVITEPKTAAASTDVVEDPTTSAASAEMTVAGSEGVEGPTTSALDTDDEEPVLTIDFPDLSLSDEEPTTSADVTDMVVAVKDADEPTTSAAIAKGSTSVADSTETSLSTKKEERPMVAAVSMEGPAAVAASTDAKIAAKRANGPKATPASTGTTAASKIAQKPMTVAANMEEPMITSASTDAAVSAERSKSTAASTKTTAAAKKAAKSTVAAANMQEPAIVSASSDAAASAARSKTPAASTRTAAASKRAAKSTPAAASIDTTIPTKRAEKAEKPSTVPAALDVSVAAKKAEIAARAAATRMSTRQRAHRLLPSEGVQLVALGPGTNRPQVAALVKQKPAVFAPPSKLRQQAKMEHQAEVLLTGVLDKAVSGGPVEAVVHDVTTRLNKVTTAELAAAICKYVGQLDSGDLWPGLVNLPASQRINYPYLSVKEKHLFTLVDQLTCEQQWRDLVWLLGEALLLDTVRRKDPTPAQFGRDVRCSAMCVFLARENPRAATAFRSLLEHVVSRTSSELAVPAVCFLAVVWPFRFGPLFAEDDSLHFRRLFVVHLAVSTPRNKRTAQGILDRVCEQKMATILPAEPADSASEWLLPMIANLRTVGDALVVRRDSPHVGVLQSKHATDLQRAILSLWTLATSVKHLPSDRKTYVLGQLLLEDQHWCELLMETSAVGSVVQRSVLLALSGQMAAVAGGQQLPHELARLLESAINARRRLLSLDASLRVDSDEIALFGLNQFINVVGGLTRSLE